MPFVPWPRLLAGAALLAVASPAASQEGPLDPRLASTWAERYTLSRWTTDDGLPQNTVSGLLQTRDGMLWIATFGGLARFDGVEFEVLDLGSDPALPGNRVVSLAEDRAGDLWIGFQFAGVARVGSRGEVHRVLEGGCGVAWDLAEAADGTMWVACSKGVVRLSSDGAADWIVRDDRQGAARSLLPVGNTMWVGGGRPALVRYGLDGAEEWRAPDHLINVTTLHQAPDGTVWASERDGLYRIRDDLLVEVDRPGPIALFEGPDGATWGGRTRVVAGLLPGSPLSAQDSPFDPDGPFAIRTGLTDREGTVWLGTVAHGLLQLKPKALHWVDAFRGLERYSVTAVATAADEGVWVGGCRGQLAHVTRDRVVPEAVPWPRMVCLSDLATDAQGALWVLGPQRRVYRRHGGAWAEVALAEPPHRLWGQDGRIYGLFRSAQIQVAELAPGGATAVATLPDSAWTVRAQILDAASGDWEVSAAPLIDSRGDLWIGLLDGVLRWNGRTLHRFGREQGLARGHVRTLHEDPGGRIWIGTYGGGLSIVDGNDVWTYTTQDGLVENIVSSIQEDARGNLWLNGNRVLSFIPVEQAHRMAVGTQETLRPVAFDQTDGYVEGNGQSSARDREGRLWFPTIEGVVSIHPDELRLNDASLGVQVQRIVVDGQPLRPITDTVPPNPMSVDVYLAAPRFLRPQNLRFRYRLGDGDWVEAGSRRVAFFTDPAPGALGLEVEVTNLESGAVRALQVPLYVEPTLLQRSWFRLLLGLGLLGSLALGLLLRDRSLRRTAEVLQAEVDARKAAEVQREAMASQLLHAQKLEAVGRLTGGIAHDFNNLLAVVLGHVELAAEQVDREDVREDLSTAQKAAERGAELTRQLLAFARRADLAPAVTDVGRLVTGMERFLVPALGSGVGLRMVVQEGLWRIRVDAARLENALLNLAFNARDAMPKGGRVTFTLRNEHVADPSRLSPSGGERCAPGDYVMISVRDTGVGIPPDLVEKVLDPFFSTKEVGKGTGLGLSMAYGFVRQSGGMLTIDSEPGSGTEIALYLPRETSNVEVASASKDVPRGSGEVVLVVEDDDGVRRIAVRYLQALGYGTLQAASVAQARFSLAGDVPVSLVLSDIVLPGVSGIEFRSELAASHPELPVVLMSGHGNPRGSADTEEAEDIFPKPFTREALARKVAEALARAASRRAAGP